MDGNTWVNAGKDIRIFSDHFEVPHETYLFILERVTRNKWTALMLSQNYSIPPRVTEAVMSFEYSNIKEAKSAARSEDWMNLYKEKK